MDFESAFNKAWESGEKHRRKLEQEFEKLALDFPAQQAAVGDRVLVAAGVHNMGFHWDRLEAVVLEVADTSYKVRFVDRQDSDGNTVEKWVHRFTVTDVLGKEANAD